MDSKSLVLLIFIMSSLFTILSVLFKLSFTLSFLKKKVKIETYFIGVLLGFILLLSLGLLPFEIVYKSLIGDSRLSPLGILILFFSMAYISIFLDYCGFFDYCARLSIQYAGNNSVILFVMIYLCVAVLTIFTSNDIVILTFTPFIYYFARDTGIDSIPLLIAEFFAANTWSMTLFVGNPTNILIAGAFGIDFFSYLQKMILPSVLAGLVNFGVLFLIFYKKNQNAF